jgi:hypothetical protein
MGEEIIAGLRIGCAALAASDGAPSHGRVVEPCQPRARNRKRPDTERITNKFYLNETSGPYKTYAVIFGEISVLEYVAYFTHVAKSPMRKGFSYGDWVNPISLLTSGKPSFIVEDPVRSESEPVHQLFFIYMYK